VVATTTAEALAMGKWVVCADHPSNRFFSQFKNCLIYHSPEEFESHLRHALSVDPEPITAEDKTRLTWEAATERFLDVAELTSRDLEITSGLAAAADGVAWLTHNTLCGVEPLRQVAGAGANTRDNPQSITDYQPSAADLGGLFDDRRRAVKAYTGHDAGAHADARVRL
jgi:digalactosyldiacylglycerol synthase